jgi:hypothetical protein
VPDASPREQKTSAVLRELQRDALRSDREIARVVGVDHKTVGARRKEIRMARALFDSAQLVIDGRPRRAMRLYCFRCGKHGECVMNTMAHGAGVEDKENRMAARKFGDMGWSVDLHKGKHFCPECNTTSSPTRKEVPMSPTVVPMPRQMSREDRRIVFEKLNDVYVDEKQGYAPPWTDEKVSTDLGVPRSWVVNVREEMFGPVSSNSDIDDALKAASALLGELKKHREQADKLATAATAIEKRLEQITKAVRP